MLGLWAWTHHQRTATEHRLEAVANVLAGRSVGVKCQGFWGAMLDINGRSGEVQFPWDGLRITCSSRAVSAAA